jgi:hypothetical protein
MKADTSNNCPLFQAREMLVSQGQMHPKVAPRMLVEEKSPWQGGKGSQERLREETD